MTSPKIIKRNLLFGAILQPLGLPFWSAELTDFGVRLLGGPGKEVPFLEWSGLAKLTSTYSFSTIVIHLTNGTEVKLAGVNPEEAMYFISAINDAFQEYIVQRFDAIKEEFENLSVSIRRLEQPRRYPAACLLTPFLERATKAIESLPTIIPDGFLPKESLHIIDTVQTFKDFPNKIRKAATHSFVESELNKMKPFFNTIESNPLTHEQQLAIVTDEDASLILAGAGSGKTSVITAKAAYLIERGIRQPDEILLVAFGKDAASEMADRIKKRSGVSVDALTFHALGNRIIREVEGRAPALADFASDDTKYHRLLRNIISDKIAKSKIGQYLIDWFSEFYYPSKNEWDFKSPSEYYQWIEAHDHLRTLNGDKVKSFEEMEISNWLYRNGIAYEYEPVYEHELPADARSTYKPDFRLTESGIYIEHFGVRKTHDPDGSIRLITAPNINCERYLEDMVWKWKVHKKNGTMLIETFSYEKVEGRLLDALKKKLAPYVEFKPVPNNQLFKTLTEMGHVDAFTQMLGTFLRHFKNSGTSVAQCHTRIEKTADTPRGRAFLKIFESVFEAYEHNLGDMIDFEDMIIRATKYVESGRYKSPYRHVLVDEFQDISAGRARLLRALKAQYSDARIFAVGDDWQSIYRFTGSDIHLMRNFGTEFGGSFAGKNGVHSTVDLGRTFRSVDKIAQPARRFILRNPSQITKIVAPAGKTTAPALMIAYYTRGQDSVALKDTLKQISAKGSNGVSVLILGRYHHLKPRALKQLSNSFPKLSIRFMTVHASKGLEADHVIILGMVSGTMGFPSEIFDDPLLNLVLPEPENFKHAEERRLFYVALTRAKKSVTILASRENPSVFVRELIECPEYGAIVIGEPGIARHRCHSCGGRMLAQTAKNDRIYFACEHQYLCGQILKPCNVCGKDLPVRKQANPEIMTCSCGAEFPVCQECYSGWLVERKGKYGKFLGCITYPVCKGTRQLPRRN